MALSFVLMFLCCDNDGLWSDASHPAQKEILLGAIIAASVPKYTVQVYVNQYTDTFVMQNGSDSITVTGLNIYSFPTKLVNGAAYNIVITSTPSFGTCSFTPAGAESGTINKSDVLITINCVL